MLAFSLELPCLAPPAALALAPSDDPGLTLPFPPIGGPESPPQPVGPMPPLGPVLTTPGWRSIVRGGPTEPTLLRAVSDGETFHTPSSGQLDLAMRRSAAAGATVVRLYLQWADVEHGPAVSADPADPAAAAYDFAAFDEQVRAAARHGLVPLVVIGDAPAAHEGPHRWRFAPPGSWAPDPEALAAFATAAARRYSGSFPDPLHPGQALPRVPFWQAWNEPNLPRYLSPQWVASNGQWLPWAPAHYRRMLNAFYAAVKTVNPSDVVISAGTAPDGDSRDGFGRMAPLRFWQEVMCLGRAPRLTLQPCADPVHLDVLAYHPLSITDPDRPATSLGVGIADIDKLRHLLRAAQRTGRVVPVGTRLWVTELNWDAKPIDPRGATPAQLARWIPRALYLLWRADVQLVTWEFLRDPLSKLTHSGGLYGYDPAAPADLTLDRPKPELDPFRFPLTAPRIDAEHVEVWSLLPVQHARRVSLQRRTGGRWLLVARVRANRLGMLDRVVPMRGRARLRLVLSGVGASPTASVDSHPTAFPAGHGSR